MKKNDYGYSKCVICGIKFKLFQYSKRTCSGRCHAELIKDKPKKEFQFKDTGFFEWENYPNGILLG
jgi:hypothetical protein